MSKLMRFLRAPTVITIAIAVLSILAEALAASLSKQDKK